MKHKKTLLAKFVSLKMNWFKHIAKAVSVYDADYHVYIYMNNIRHKLIKDLKIDGICFYEHRYSGKIYYRTKATDLIISDKYLLHDPKHRSNNDR